MPESTITPLGKRIKQGLADLAMSRNELAHELGVERPIITKWVTGAKRPARNRLEQMADLFRCNVDELQDLLNTPTS